MNDRQPGGSAPERAKLIALILRGRKKSAGWDLDDQLDGWKITDFFRGLQLREIEGTLTEFEHSSVRERRAEASKLLSAFFAWTTFTTLCPKGMDATAVDQLKLRFLDIVLARMVGFENPHGNLKSIPHWSSPSAAYGWASLPHRESKDHTRRDMAICAAYELLMRKRIPPCAAVRQLGKQFAPKSSRAKDAGVSTVQKALRDTGPLFFRGRLSNQELQGYVDMKNLD